MVLASMRLGTGTGDDGDPRLHDTAAQSLPNGRGTGTAVTMVPRPAAGVVWVSIESGTRQLTATAATVTRSRRHLDATIERSNLPVRRQESDPARGPRDLSVREALLGQVRRRSISHTQATLIRFVAFSSAAS